MQVHVRAPLQRGTRNAKRGMATNAFPRLGFRIPRSPVGHGVRAAFRPVTAAVRVQVPLANPISIAPHSERRVPAQPNPPTRRPAQPWRPYGKPTAHPQRRAVFSRPPANAGRASLPRRRSGVASASSTATKSCAGSWAGTTSARAARTTAFRNCCLRAGRFDGSRRNHYFRE